MEDVESRFINIPSSALILSIAIHIAIPVLFLVTGALDEMGISLFPKPKKMDSLYQSYIQVDVVGLPDETISEKASPIMPEVVNPEKAPEVKPAAPPTPLDVMDDLKQKTKAEKTKKEKLEQEKAMAKALEEARREQALKSLQVKAGKSGRNKIKGNIVSQGTASSGAIGTPKDRYHGILTESIKQHFNVYSWQQKKTLGAKVRMRLGPNGRVKLRQIVETSRDPLFDAAVLQAIDEAAPFPLPDEKALLDDEIIIDFKP